MTYPDPDVPPCYECGTTDRVGTACRKCNPEITDEDFGMDEPLPELPWLDLETITVTREQLADLIWENHCFVKGITMNFVDRRPLDKRSTELAADRMFYFHHQRQPKEDSQS